MAVRYFEVWAADNKTVVVRILRLSDQYVFDFDAGAFKSSLAACSQPRLSLSEQIDTGDSDESLYLGSLDFDKLNSTSSPKSFIIQAAYVPLEIVQNAEVWVKSGRPVEEIQMSAINISGDVSAPGVSGQIGTSSLSGSIGSFSISGQTAVPDLVGSITGPAVSGSIGGNNISGAVTAPGISGIVEAPDISGQAS